MDTAEPSRIGILYRGKRCIRSIRVVFGCSELEKLGELEEVEQWMEGLTKRGADQDDSYLSYFYRCLEEGSVYYYLYEKGVGWSCGDVTGKSPISSQLVRLEDAIPEMEEWAIGLKYRDSFDL